VQLERTLTLLANGEIDIKLVTEVRESTGTKRKRKAVKSTTWKVEQLGGPPQAFSDTLWGGATRDYMAVLRQVPPEAMASIIADARSIATNHRARCSTIQSEQPRSERAGLTFR
jgi:hypothetical protein